MAGGRRRGSFVRVRVKADRFFEREGDNIHTTIPVTFSEAYRGGEIEVGTCMARCEPSSRRHQFRADLRLRGKGVRNTKTRAYGDHLYTVQVVVPKVCRRPARKPRAASPSSTSRIPTTAPDRHLIPSRLARIGLDEGPEALRTRVAQAFRTPRPLRLSLAKRRVCAFFQPGA